MASNRVLAKSINMPFLQSNNKVLIYISTLEILRKAGVAPQKTSLFYFINVSFIRH